MQVNNKLVSLYILIVGIFTIFTCWFLYIQFVAFDDENLHNYFTDSYGILAGLGGCIGLGFISPKWNFFKSIIGKSISYLSLGLIFQFLGQLSYTLEYYLYGIENSYPSFGEIFYFGSIPLYIIGVYYLAKAGGAKFSLRNKLNKFIVMLIPICMIIWSYMIFLNHYDFTDIAPLTIFFDFAYPIGQAIYISISLASYYLTTKYLGGIMRKPIVLVLLGLTMQYVADSTFIYQNIKGIWGPGQYGDYLFVLSYFLISLGIIQFLTVWSKIEKFN